MVKLKDIYNSEQFWGIERLGRTSAPIRLNCQTLEVL